MYGYIYLITNNINGKQYIGQHKYNKPELDPKYITSGIIINEAIEKYGLNNFNIEIIDLADSADELDQKEIFWIKEKNSKAPSGYNLTDGGDGITNMSDEIKLKISKTKTGTHLSKEHKNKIGIASKNVIRTKEWCNNISNSLKQKKGITKNAIIAHSKKYKDKLTYTNGEDVIYLDKNMVPPKGYLHLSKKGYKKLMQLCNRISKEELENYYNSSSLRDTAKYFNITRNELKSLINYYSIELHSKADSIRNSNLKNYGIENIAELDWVKEKIKISKLK